MRKNGKMGSAAPFKKQQTLEDKYECYAVDSMPQNVKTRSKGLVNSENDITKVVKTLMEGEVIGTPKWCRNRIDTFSSTAVVVISDHLLKSDKIEIMEKLLGGDVAVKAIGDALWLVTVFWME